MAQILGKHVLQRAGQLPKVAARFVLGEPRVLASLEQLGEIARVTVLDAELEKRKIIKKRINSITKVRLKNARDHPQLSHERNEAEKTTKLPRARTLDTCACLNLCGRGDEEYWDAAFEP